MKSSDPVYGRAGKAIVRVDHMVLIIPKKQLAPGLQKVSLLLHGRSKISWSFTVIARPPTIPWTTTAKPEEISWSAPPLQAGNPTLGYDVLVGDSNLKRFETYRATTTAFSTTSMGSGNYWVCVKVIARYRNGDCLNLFPYTVKPGSLNLAGSATVKN